MANELTSSFEARALTDADLNTLELAGIIPAGTPAPQVALFARACKEKGLSPFTKQIYLTKYNTKAGPIFSTIVGIDGYRSLAARTGLHAGTDDAVFNLQPDGSYKTAAQLISSRQVPLTSTSTVYKVVAGVRCAFTHTVLFSEFSTGQQKWQSMPFQMIAKVSESFALKKAFPDELAGLSIPEEHGAYEETTERAINYGRAEDKTPTVVIDETTGEKYTEIEEYLVAYDNMQTFMQYWASFKQSELGNNRLFVELFFKKAALLASSYDELLSFHNSAQEWQRDAGLKAILAARKTAIETKQKEEQNG